MIRVEEARPMGIPSKWEFFRESFQYFIIQMLISIHDTLPKPIKIVLTLDINKILLFCPHLIPKTDLFSFGSSKAEALRVFARSNFLRPE